MNPRRIKKTRINKLKPKRGHFKKYSTHFGGKYWGYRLVDREIAFEYLEDGTIRICLCLPYDIEKEEKARVVGFGAGEVLDEWIAQTEHMARKIINEKCLTEIRIDKY